MNSNSKKYGDWACEYPNYLVLMLAGYFYMAWGRSAEVLNEVLDYKLVYTRRNNIPYTGGPSLEVIEEALIDNCFNYIVIERGIIVEKRDFKYCNEVFYRKEDFANNSRSTACNYSDEDKIQFIEVLLEGIDPNSGEILAEDHIVNDDITKEILTMARNAIVRKQNREKNARSCAGKKWTDEEDEQLLEEYREKVPIKKIAELHERSEGAIRSRLLNLHPIEL